MAFTNGNFKEAGGPGNKTTGGQVYSYHSTTDTVATIMASGYFDDIADSLNDGDLMIISGSAGTQLARLTNTAGVITTEPVADSAGPVDAVAGGGGAASLLTAISNVTSTGADVITLADGLYIGQKKTIVHAVDGGSAVITPANMLGFTTCTLLAVGDTCQLQWNGTGWVVIGRGGAVEPVIA